MRTRSSSWWITRTELHRDGTRALYHRNGGRRPGWEQKVTLAWDHPDTDDARAACDVCSTPTATPEERRQRRAARIAARTQRKLQGGTN